MSTTYAYRTSDGLASNAMFARSAIVRVVKSLFDKAPFDDVFCGEAPSGKAVSLLPPQNGPPALEGGCVQAERLLGFL